jgi:hypothetical protein
MTYEDVLSEIKELSAANRRGRDTALEARLVALRRDAAAQIGPIRQPRSWPPRVKDSFRGVTGIPEIAADQLTTKVVQSAILRHGSLLVRGLIAQPRVDQLVDEIDHAFAAHDAHVHGAPTTETEPWFVPFDPGPAEHVPRDWIREGGGVLGVDSPRALFDVIEAFEEVGIGDLVASYLGEHPVILAKKLTLRRIAGSDRHPTLGDPDWHQDGAFMGRDIRSINVWVSLSRCGVDAPGLDVVAQRLDHIVDTGVEGANFDWSVGHPLVERIAPGAIVRPVFEPGDALLFDHMMLHRTAISPTMTKHRYAIEAWFAAPSSYPADQVPIAY